MAKFRDSHIPDLDSAGPVADVEQASHVHDRSIGSIISETRNLSPDQIEQILQYQRTKGVRFGEAAVALGLAKIDDVLYALSQQFHYPYAPEERRKLSPELVSLAQPFSPRAEAFRAIRSQLMMRVFGETATPRRALAVISPDRGDGKSYFAANIAVTLAQLGGRTLLVDADLRGPRQHEIFLVENQSGLSGVLAGRAETNVIRQVAGIPSLFVLPVGILPPNPQELVERPAFGLLLRELAGKFDHVVVDTPAFSVGSDSIVIAARCGAALIIARRNASKVASLQELVGMFAESPAEVAGVVYNEF